MQQFAYDEPLKIISSPLERGVFWLLSANGANGLTADRRFSGNSADTTPQQAEDHALGVAWKVPSVVGIRVGKIRVLHEAIFPDPVSFEFLPGEKTIFISDVVLDLPKFETDHKSEPDHAKIVARANEEGAKRVFKDRNGRFHPLPEGASVYCTDSVQRFGQQAIRRARGWSPVPGG